MKQIEKTKDYEQFSFIKGNRPVTEKKLKKLRQAIEKDNQLNIHPIIVNMNYGIVDGQHRFTICKEKNLDVYYIQSDVPEEHIVDANVCQNGWELKNYLFLYAEKNKNPDYIIINNYIQGMKINPKALFTLMLGNVSSAILDFLKSGMFKLPKNKDYERVIDRYNDFIAYTEERRITPRGMFSNFQFTKAFRWLLNTQGFDYDIFLKKLDQKWFDLKPQRAAEDWYKLLISIYNFKNQNRLEEEYGSAVKAE